MISGAVLQKRKQHESSKHIAWCSPGTKQQQETKNVALPGQNKRQRAIRCTKSTPLTAAKALVSEKVRPLGSLTLQVAS